MTLRALFLLGGLAVFVVGCLWAERILVERRLAALRFRVAVTGTRGKSSVTRLVAAALRRSGLRVLAKTTGSAAMAILPDGTEQEIPRSGPPSILENRSVLRLAVRHKAEALVCEMMSISPECLEIESRKLLRPDLLLVTNVRVDHREEQGATREEVARSLSSALRPGCAVLVPESESFPVFERTALRLGARLVRLPDTSSRDGDPQAAGLLRTEFTDNVRLALAAAERCGVARAVALEGMAGAEPDLGGLKIYRMKPAGRPGSWFLVSAFAANDPGSARLALNKAKGLIEPMPGRLSAVLNLREDRGDRTVQWLDALRGGFFDGFSLTLVVGSPAVSALKRRIRRLQGQASSPAGRILVLGEKSPERITALATAGPEAERGGVLVGLGNMGGLGRMLLAHWQGIGQELESGRA